MYIYIKWLPFKNVLDVWNFSTVLQFFFFDKLNVFCLCKIEYACQMVVLYYIHVRWWFCIIYMSLYWVYHSNIYIYTGFITQTSTFILGLSPKHLHLYWVYHPNIYIYTGFITQTSTFILGSSPNHLHLYWVYHPNIYIYINNTLKSKWFDY
jgi:hypothetical protein